MWSSSDVEFLARPSPPQLQLWGTYQRRVLDIIPQQPCVIEGVLGLLLYSIYRPLFHLVFYGLEEFVEGLTGAILEQGGCVSGRHGTDKHSGAGLPSRLVGTDSPTPGSRVGAYLEVLVQTDGHPVGQHPLHYCLRPEGKQMPHIPRPGWLQKPTAMQM